MKASGVMAQYRAQVPFRGHDVSIIKADRLSPMQSMSGLHLKQCLCGGTQAWRRSSPRR